MGSFLEFSALKHACTSLKIANINGLPNLDLAWLLILAHYAFPVPCALYLVPWVTLSLAKTESSMQVFKFGGASVNSVERIKNVADILRKYKNEKILIV